MHLLVISPKLWAGYTEGKQQEFVEHGKGAGLEAILQGVNDKLWLKFNGF